MESTMTHKKKLKEIVQRQEQNTFSSELSRGRSVTVGTCFGGVTEIMIRGNGEHFLWVPLQPVEAVELIHQLAANIGCHVALKPRADFASWRKWKVEPHMDAGPLWPPFSNDIAPHMSVGANLPSPDQQPGLQPALMARSNENETVAIEKPKNRRGTKRAAKAA